MNITDQESKTIVEAGQAKAKDMGLAVIIAILDDGANLKSFHRMDGAVLGSIDIAHRKARTAVLFQAPSEAVWDYLKPGAPAPGLELTNGGLAPYAGGIPLFTKNGMFAGAIGVSGGSIAQDAEIAKAAANAYQN